MQHMRWTRELVTINIFTGARWLGFISAIPMTIPCLFMLQMQPDKMWELGKTCED